MPNRLAYETSPYLLQHQNNPVDWYPWGEEAFEKAKAEGMPIFLSVGYSSCHWCHVMEHESFEDERVAEILNRDFVSVKVDREERPDVDEAYMTAVQLSSGRGGWPMSVFLTPDLKPFFAGTYFPVEDRGGHPGFLSILRQLAETWKSRRLEVQKAADDFAKALRQTLTQAAPGTFAKLDEAFLSDAIRALAADFDQQNGGFGQAPKFPPHTGIEFLLNYVTRPSATDDMREVAFGIAISTLEKMALGGIHDHVGGGFHRYSTDERWLLPHFEMMLYDNALMLGNYARASALIHEMAPDLERLFIRTVRGIIDWVDREMTSPEGLFFSALDADSEGEEGKFYVWTTDEVRQVLGERADAFLLAYNFQPEGNFRDEATGQLTGANIPYLTEPRTGEFEEELALLRAHRESRVRPGLDDKVLISWNGLMIGALAESGVMDRAMRAALRILEIEQEAGYLPHQFSRGKAAGPAYLDGYAYLIDGLLRIAAYRAFLEEHEQLLREQGYDVDSKHPAAFWRAEAMRLAREMVDRFYDHEKGGFFYSSPEHQELFGRSKPAFDQPTPSGNAMALRVLVELGDWDRASKTVEANLGWMQRAPQATEAMYLAAMPLVPAEEIEPEEPDAPTAITVERKEVTVDFPNRELVASNGEAMGEIVITVPEGMHVNSSQPPARWLTPTEIKIAPVGHRVDYPEPAGDGYYGVVRIPFWVKLPEGKRSAEFEVRVSYQACTQSECQLPQEKVLSGVVLAGA